MEELKREYVYVNPSIKILVLLFAYAIHFDNVILIPILTNFVFQLGGDYFIAGIAVGLYSAVYIPTTILAGYLLDKIGRKKLLSVGLMLDAFSLFLYYLSNSIPLLIIARAIHGVGGGFGGPSTISYLSDVSPRERGSRNMALYGIFIGLSYLLGFAYSGMISYYYGYRTLFLTVSVFLFVLSLTSLPLPEIYRVFSDKLREISERYPITKILGDKKIILAYLTIFAVYFNLGTITTIYPKILKNAGYDERLIAAALSTFIIASILIQYPSGRLGDVIGEEVLIVFGTVLTSISMIIISLGTSSTYVFLGMAIFGFAHGIIFPTTAGLIRKETFREIRGKAMGIFFGLMVFSVAIGAPLIGFLAKISLTWAFSVAALVPLLSLIIYYFLKIL